MKRFRDKEKTQTPVRREREREKVLCVRRYVIGQSFVAAFVCFQKVYFHVLVRPDVAFLVLKFGEYAVHCSNVDLFSHVVLSRWSKLLLLAHGLAGARNGGRSLDYHLKHKSISAQIHKGTHRIVRFIHV